MRITIAYNLRTDDTEATAELLAEADINRIYEAISSLQHTVTVVEVSGKPNAVIERIIESEPDLIFNLAEGTIGSSREAFYPGLYEQMGIPFTGGNASLLHLNLDKHLAKTMLSSRGISVSSGVLITENERDLPEDLQYPLMIKPNSEGSSKGITQDSVVETRDQALERINRLLSHYPSGLVVEEYIQGRELSVPFLESFPGKLLDIVEHTFDLSKIGGKYNIYDYDMKQGGEAAKSVKVSCPANLNSEEEKAVVKMARDVFQIMSCPDVGRVDIRLHTNGKPYFIELNPLPSLHPNASLMTAAKSRGLEFRDALRLVIRSAANRYGLAIKPAKQPKKDDFKSEIPRPNAREIGIQIGRMRPGINNAITDVKGVRVGHFSRIEDNVQIPGSSETCHIRTGVTAIMPAGQAYSNRIAAGGFILNGVGEMAGFTQVIERSLDKEFDQAGRREVSEGSIIVVVATDIPLINSQLNRVAKRAALGLGRTGSYAASTSGEIIIAFSTGNRKPRVNTSQSNFINLKCISDHAINTVYEAVVEATEEAVINAIFCSNGMNGREQRWCPAIPQQRVVELLNKGN